MKHNKYRNNKYKKYSIYSQRLQKPDKYGRIYLPAFVRKIFRGYLFFVVVENGKIVLDPIKEE